MEQLSRPYQIALAAILVFALAYFLVLKPGGDEPAPDPAASAPAAPTAPGVAGLGRAVDKANGAVAQSDSSAESTQDAAAAASGEPTAGTPSAPAGGSAAAPEANGATPADGGLEPGDASGQILDDVKGDKVAVVLFYNAKGADDRAVRRALKDVPRFKGKVRVRQIPIERVADYPAITQGVPVTQAPTLLVLDKDRSARRLVGYQDTKSIQQLVGDVGGSRFRTSATGGYRTRVANICTSFRSETDALSTATGDLTDLLRADRAQLSDALRRTRALDPPRGFSAFQSSLQDALDVQLRIDVRALRAERANATGGAVVQAGSVPTAKALLRLRRLAVAKGIEECS